MTGNPTNPTLSVTLPVYNGERHVTAALDSLLAQTYDDFEIIICDNASTDRTGEICQQYAARDGRIRYHRNPENVGAAPNFNLAFDMAKAPFFKWASHDDVIEPEYLERCMDLMLNDDTMVVCHSDVILIDDDGKFITEHTEGLDEAGSDDPAVRFRNLIMADHWCTDVFGVIRRDALAKTPRIARYVGSDRVLLAELALHGRYGHVDQPLFSNRDHSGRSVHATGLRSEERLAWFDPTLRRAHPMPILQCWHEYVRALHRAPTSFSTRMRCYKALMAWFLPNRWAVRSDIENAARHFGVAMKRRLGAGSG